MNIDTIVKLALEEDLPNGDLTTDNLGITEKIGSVKLVAKEDLILSSIDLFEHTVLKLDSSASFSWQFRDGDRVLKGQVVSLIRGNLLEILKAERVALNFIGRFSGIASLTRCFVEALGESKTQILDTRKTTPLYRELEKRAVRHGGGVNHRLNLSDAILIKENHIRAVGDFKKTLETVKKNSNRPIEVETTNLNEVQLAIEMNVARIMLDNFSNDDLKAALKIIPSNIETEASGNMTIPRIREIHNLGLSFISVGALTHSAPTADLSLIFDWT